MLEKSTEPVKVRRIAKVAGLIGSFFLAMGNVARFYSRGMLTQVARVVNKEGWESVCVPDEKVVAELRFWEKNLRSLNGWTIREYLKTCHTARKAVLICLVTHPNFSWREHGSRTGKSHGTRGLRLP